MSGNIDRIPYPPDQLPGRSLALTEDRPEELWRLHWEDDPNDPNLKNPGKCRFDAPSGEFKVTYTNEERHHIFVEVYGDTDDRREIAASQAERKISIAKLTRPLGIVDLGDAATLSRLRLDERICTTTDYPRTQRWCLKIREFCPEADGIRYPGRKSGRADNRCLFLDKCADALDWSLVGTIDSERVVWRACHMFEIVPTVYLAPRAPAWP